MGIADIILIIIFLGFFLFGFWFGFVHTFGSTLGFFIGIFVASRTYDLLPGSFIFKIFSFIFIFIFVERLVGIVFYIVDKIFDLLKFIPFTKTINRLLGAGLGAVEGVLVITGISFIISYYNWETVLSNSKIIPIAYKISSILIPFLTKALKIIIS